MAYPIEQEIVIAIAASALFDSSESHQIYLDEGIDAYRAHNDGSYSI
jgi:5'-nucleotidase